MKLQVEKVSSIGSSNKVALFQFVPDEGQVLPEGTVCLSRNKPGSCNFVLDKLQEHNGHAPGFTDEVMLQSYIDRIILDVETLLEGTGSLDKESKETYVPLPPGTPGSTLHQN